MHHFYSVRLQFGLVSLLFLLCAPIAQAVQADWPLAPSRLDLSTPYGDLHIKPNDYIYESTLLVNNVETEPKIEGILNITYAFATPHSNAALISINNGSTHCPYSYRWVILDKKGYKISPGFGSCSAQIKVSATSRALIVETPNSKNPDKIDIYRYNGKTVKRRTQP